MLALATERKQHVSNISQDLACYGDWFGPSRCVNIVRAVHHLNAVLDFATRSFDVCMVRAPV